MMFMPFQILTLWLTGLLSIAILGGGVYLLWEWYQRSYVWQDRVHQVVDAANRVVEVRTDPDEHAVWFLVGGLALLALAFAGGTLYRFVLRRPGDDEPKPTRDGTVRRISRPDGSEPQVEFYGPEDGPTIVLTHGWGANSTEWYYVKRQLGDRFRLIVWDLPGLGLSKQPENRDYRLENLASHLDAVVAQAGDRPVVLLGHSIGGMIMLTYCRLFPEALGRKVSGLVLVHTTYTNPVKTTRGAAFFSAIQKPVLVPLLHLMIGVWPLVWLMNWMSYLNGTAHLSTDRDSFSGGETRGQLEFTTRFMPHASPAVLARGMLGMLRYDATEVLGSIPIPTLIVAGDRDGVTKPDASDVMERAIPSTERVTLAPAKHMGLLEHNRPFAEAVDAFVVRCSSPAAGVS